MAKSYKVTAAVAVVRVSDTERYIYRGATVPSDATKESIEHLLGVGLIAEVDGSGSGSGDAGSGGDELPAGDPTEAWTVKQLRAFAAAHDVNLKGASSKEDVLAVLTAPAPAGDAPSGDNPSAGA